MMNCIIGKINLVTFTSEGYDFDGFKSGGPHEKYAAAIWNVGTISKFA
jgi:hypothetical protein